MNDKRNTLLYMCSIGPPLNQDTGVMACDLCVGEGEEGGVKTVYACLSERLIGRARNKH